MPRALQTHAFHDPSRQLANVDCLPVAHTSSPSLRLETWRKRMASTMPEKAKELPDLHETAGCAVADYMREKYPRHTAKMVARDVGCEPCTAKNWLRGYLPGSKHLLTMMERWGLDFLVCLLEPVDASIAREIRLKHELEKLTQELHRLKEEINQPES